MLRLIPPPVHRVMLRLAYRLRRRALRLFKPDLASVSIILTNQQDQLLLVRHSYGPQGWALPGGGLGRKEDPWWGIRREIREELQCEVQALDLIGTFEETLSGARHTAYLFAARPLDEPRADGRELLEARWFERETVAGLDLTRVTRERLLAVDALEQ